MTLFDYTKPKMIIADKNKHIRSVNDAYVPGHLDEQGNMVETHYPEYSTMMFVPDSITEEEMYELYVEEEIND